VTAVKTKIELVNGAFAELRISGLTSATDAEDIELGLAALEDVMHDVNLSLPFNFEELPDPNTESGLPEFATLAIKLKLAERLAPSYNKSSAIPGLPSAWSRLITRLSQPKYLQPSALMPLGRGNRPYFCSNNYMPAPVNLPSGTIELNINDAAMLPPIDFGDYLQPGEVISSVTDTAEAGVTVLSDAITGDSYNIEVQAGTATGLTRIKLDMVGDMGSKRTRYIYLNIVDGTSANG
jgi:hypothetical protein